jgi:hypothetical protein
MNSWLLAKSLSLPISSGALKCTRLPAELSGLIDSRKDNCGKYEAATYLLAENQEAFFLSNGRKPAGIAIRSAL